MLLFFFFFKVNWLEYILHSMEIKTRMYFHEWHFNNQEKWSDESVILNCDNIAVVQTFIPFTFFRRDNQFSPCYLSISFERSFSFYVSKKYSLKNTIFALGFSIIPAYFRLCVHILLVFVEKKKLNLNMHINKQHTFLVSK